MLSFHSVGTLFLAITSLFMAFNSAQINLSDLRLRIPLDLKTKISKSRFQNAHVESLWIHEKIIYCNSRHAKLVAGSCLERSDRRDRTISLVELLLSQR